jgi:hypothetical protein
LAFRNAQLKIEMKQATKTPATEQPRPSTHWPVSRTYKWEIVRLCGTPAQHLGYADAVDEAEAIRKAIAEFRVGPAGEADGTED